MVITTLQEPNPSKQNDKRWQINQTVQNSSDNISSHNNKLTTTDNSQKEQ